MRNVLIIALLLGGCAAPQSYGYDPVADQIRQANQASWARWYMGQNMPSYTYAQPVAPSGPRCYHVTATGRCLHWGP